MASPAAVIGTDEEALNSLLRGELAAVETFDQALAKFQDGHPEVWAALARIRAEHQGNVRRLQETVRRHGGVPATSSGPWGSFAAAVTGAAMLLGPQTTLAALRTGEEHGLDDYQSVLDNPKVGDDVKAAVRDVFLPAAQQHIQTLAALSASLGG